MTNEQIERMLAITNAIEIDHSTFDTLAITAGKVSDMDDDTALIEASFEEDDLIYEETITVGDLRKGEIDCDVLKLQDGRSLRFLKTRVIEWEEFDTCES